MKEPSPTKVENKSTDGLWQISPEMMKYYKRLLCPRTVILSFVLAFLWLSEKGTSFSDVTHTYFSPNDRHIVSLLIFLTKVRRHWKTYLSKYLQGFYNRNRLQCCLMQKFLSSKSQ